MASTYLTRTPSTAGNRKTWTYSAWFKIGNVSTGPKRLFTSYDGSTATNQSTISLGGGVDYAMQIYNAPSGSSSINLTTNRLFRDCNAWYHIVVAVDTTQATGSDRVKLYINGVQETSFSTETYGSQNEDFFINSTNLHTIGRRQDNSQYFDGSMSHVHFIDGTQYQASDFGQYDANGVWTINTSPSVTYGTNGFFILKDGNSVTDQSGNSNNFTVGGGTLTNTEDSPSNVFATLNALAKGSSVTLSNGNLTNTSGSTAAAVVSTIGVSQGKWFIEAVARDSVDDNSNIGVSTVGDVSGISYLGSNTTSWCYATDGNIYNNGSDILNTGTTHTFNDVIGMAVDMDNGQVFFYKNGTIINSGSACITGLSGDVFLGSGAGNSIVDFNFGNGYFGTTAVASAGTNASGNGIFEYDVPTGYTALSTKGLNL